MAAKTYIRGLAKVAQQLCKYGRKYETQIRAHLTTEQESLFNAALAACAALDVAINVFPLGD